MHLRQRAKFTLFSDHDGSLLRQQPGALLTTMNKLSGGVAGRVVV